MLCVVQALGAAMILLQTVACPVNDMTLALLVTLRKHAMAGICALPAGHAVSDLEVRAGQCDACPGNSGSKLRQASVLSRLPICGGVAALAVTLALQCALLFQLRHIGNQQEGADGAGQHREFVASTVRAQSQLISLVWGFQAAIECSFLSAIIPQSRTG